MFYIPLRRLLVPALLCLAVLVIYRSSHRSPSAYLSSLVVDQPVVTIPRNRVAVKDLTSHAMIVQDPESGKHIEPPTHLYYEFGDEVDIDEEADPTKFNESMQGPHYIDPIKNRYLRPLLQCRIEPNNHTGHIRLPVYLRPISMVLYGDSENEKRSYLNAAILSLPYWSPNQYLLVARVQTDGSMQLNIICEANICYTNATEARPGEKPCDEDDNYLLGGAEGMRCATPPVTLNVPPTPAKSCGEGTGVLMDIPGFHDPRIFWTGKGEPLMMMNTQSRYACFGLWVIDLRQLHYPLDPLLSSNPKFPSFGPLMSYPSLTEITRNPPESRGMIEKNWMFFSTAASTYVHYDLGPSVRSFAKLLGGGLSTPNLTDPLEQPCLREGAFFNKNEDLGGSWHQATNSLRLILCERTDGSCRSRPENTVFWSLIHHKHKNIFHLPLRYERYFVIWSSTPPFNMLAISSHPILLANETAGGWDADENWEDDKEHQEMVKNYGTGKENFAVFTYTVSIAYSWGRFEDQPQDKYTGFLDDEVIIGLGVDDEAQNYARVKVSELLQCMRVCPPRAAEPLDGSGDPEYVARKKAEEEEAAKGGKKAFNEDKFGGNDNDKKKEDERKKKEDEKDKDDAEEGEEELDEVTESALESEALFEEKKKLAKAKETDTVLQVATAVDPDVTGIPANAELAKELAEGEKEKEKPDVTASAKKAKQTATEKTRVEKEKDVKDEKKADSTSSEEKQKADTKDTKETPKEDAPKIEGETPVEEDAHGEVKDKDMPTLQEIKAATGNMPKPDVYADYGAVIGDDY